MAEIQRTARRQFVSQTRTRAIGINTQQGDERTAILSGLAKFASAGNAEANRQQKAEIETQKALGASRAAQDLLVADQNRQGITEEDTLAAKLSYNAIVGKSDTIKAGNDFAEWYQANADVDEETIEAKKAELYQPLFEKYAGDERSLKQISLQVQESQFNLIPVQEKIRGQYQHQKNTEALTMSLGNMLSDPNADVEHLLTTEVPAQAKALNLSEFDYKKMIMSEMTNRAANGDGRLLEKLKSTDWAKDSVLISKAESAYNQFTSRENAIAIGDALGQIELDNKALTEPWSTTLRKVEQLNKQFPNAVSAAKVAQMKQARANATKENKANTVMMAVSWDNLFNEDGLPLQLDGRYTPEQKKKFVKGLDKIFADKTQELIAGGVSETEANTIMMKQRLDWSRVNRVKVPLLEQNLQGLLSLNPEDYETAEGLPAYANDALATLGAMDAQILELYFSGRDEKTFAANIKAGLATREPYSAFKRAVNIKNNPYKSTQAIRTEISDEVSIQVEEKLDVSWRAKLGGAKDVPAWQVAQLKSRVNDTAMTNAYNGMLDPETNAKQSVAEVMKDYQPTFNGTMININKAKLAKDIKVPVKKVDEYIEAFTLSSLDKLSEQYGGEVLAEDVSLDFSPNGTFIYRYKGGEQLGGRLLQEDLYKIGRNADLQKLRDLRSETIKERNERLAEEETARQHAEHMALFYKEWGESLKH
ncbi:hypothetical protein PV_011 (endogenous virus) [Gutovirus Vc1]|uniref:Uncharacterized protein n=1 Tax=Vibrio phage Vc1 TaxID=1480731 RepID=X2KPK1_9CAUD|nr:lysozyme domain-containing protein [Vibrio phage Vc1]AHN84662.1 hypothetical protein PV_011 [Vibrio phage Vc1]